MTEAEWLACTNPMEMLWCLRVKASDRKSRLFACACCRRIWHLIPAEEAKRCVEVAELYADASASDEEIEASIRGSMHACNVGWRQGSLNSRPWAREAVNAVGRIHRTEGGGRSGAIVATASAWAIAEIQKEGGIQGSKVGSAERLALFRQDEQRRQTGLIRDIFGNPFRHVGIDRSWVTLKVSNIAATAYKERALASGQLDPAGLADVADALFDAGCMGLRHFSPLSRTRAACQGLLGSGFAAWEVVNQSNKTLAIEGIKRDRERMA